MLPDDLITLLYDWQRLAGAFLGGIFALLVAWYVAKDARAREERSAAMVAVSALLRFAGSYRAAEIKAKKDNELEDKITLAVAGLFALHSPTISASATAAMQRLLLVNAHLAAHLSLLEMINGEIEAALSRWRRDEEQFSKGGEKEFARNLQSMLADAKTIRGGASRMINHAACATVLLNRLVLSRFPTFHRLRVTIWRSGIDKMCREGLRLGEFRKPIPWD